MSYFKSLDFPKQNNCTHDFRLYSIAKYEAEMANIKIAANKRSMNKYKIYHQRRKNNSRLHWKMR